MIRSMCKGCIYCGSDSGTTICGVCGQKAYQYDKIISWKGITLKDRGNLNPKVLDLRMYWDYRFYPEDYL